MPVVYDELAMPEPGPDPESPQDDPGAPQEWTATRWEDGGGIARDNRGDTVIFDSDGTVATATPTGSSVTRPDGSAVEDRLDAGVDAEPETGDGAE